MINFTSEKQALEYLQNLFVEHTKRKYTTYNPVIHVYKKPSGKNENKLKNTIKQWAEYFGAVCVRTNNMGVFRYSETVEVIKKNEIVGIGKAPKPKVINHFSKSTGTKGMADLYILYKGVTVFVETKCTGSQSDEQKAFQDVTEQNGGNYLICWSFVEFLNKIQKYLQL